MLYGPTGALLKIWCIMLFNQKLLVHFTNNHKEVVSNIQLNITF